VACSRSTAARSPETGSAATAASAFGGGTSVTVRSVEVTGTGAPDFSVGLTTGAKHFEHGISSGPVAAKAPA
jgi:hypothetical protein